MIDFDKLCNEFCTGMDLYKTITKLHHMDIKYHVMNTDNSFCFLIPIIGGIAEIEIEIVPEQRLDEIDQRHNQRHAERAHAGLDIRLMFFNLLRCQLLHK